MMRPIASTICDQRSRSRDSCSLPAAVSSVVLRPLVGLAHVPLGLQPSALLEAVQRGIERAGFDLEQVVGLRADGLADAVAVLGPPLQGPKNEHVEGALEELQAPVVGSLGHSRRRSTALDVGHLQLVPTRDYADKTIRVIKRTRRARGRSGSATHGLTARPLLQPG